MIVEKEDIIKTYSSCNFCNKGTLRDEYGGYHPTLKYPYRHVYTLAKENGSGLKAAICMECAQELYEKVLTLEKS